MATILYLFGCLEEDCCGKKGSWRVFRCTDAMQRQAEEDDRVPSPRQNTADQENDTVQDADAWGLNVDDDVLHSEAFDFGDLQEQLRTVTADISSSSSRSKKDAYDGDDRTSVKQTWVRQFDGYFPEFFLVQSGIVKDTENRDVLGVEDSSSSDDEHPSTEALENAHMSENGDDEEGGTASWEGESYEPDNVICGDGRTAPDGHMLKFIQHISAIPDQCLRLLYTASYTRSLPFSSKEEDSYDASVDTCPSCNAPRACVAQVTSPLIAALIESLDMVPAADHFRSPPTSWEWAVIEIHVCSKLCIGRTDQDKATLIEEVVSSMGEA